MSCNLLLFQICYKQLTVKSVNLRSVDQWQKLWAELVKGSSGGRHSQVGNYPCRILGESSRPITGEHPRMRESIFGACKREEPDHELRVRTLSMGAVEAAPLFLCSSRPEIRVVPAEGVDASSSACAFL